jgi:hypothetical protein
VVSETVIGEGEEDEIGGGGWIAAAFSRRE